MRHASIYLISALTVILLAGAVILAVGTGRVQGQQLDAPTEVPKGPVTQVVPASGDQSYTQQVSNVYCYAPDIAQNSCYINLRYAHFGATSPDAVDYVKISIDGKLVSKEMAVFETDLYYSYDMNPLSFKVPCGNAGESGNPDPKVGHAYQVSVEGYKYPDTFMGGYYMTTSCPAFAPTQP